MNGAAGECHLDPGHFLSTLVQGAKPIGRGGVGLLAAETEGDRALGGVLLGPLLRFFILSIRLDFGSFGSFGSSWVLFPCAGS